MKKIIFTFIVISLITVKVFFIWKKRSPLIGRYYLETNNSNSDSIFLTLSLFKYETNLQGAMMGKWEKERGDFSDYIQLYGDSRNYQFYFTSVGDTISLCNNDIGCFIKSK